MIICGKCANPLTEADVEIAIVEGQIEIQVTCPHCGETKYYFVEYSEMIKVV